MNKKLMKTLRSCTAFEGGNLLVARLLAIPADAFVSGDATLAVSISG